MPQQFVDVELLRSYRTASNETKRMLEEIYGEETFGVFTSFDQIRVIGCIAMELLEEKEGVTVTYPWTKDGKLMEVHITLERRTDKFQNAEISDSIFNRAIERFKKLTTNKWR